MKRVICALIFIVLSVVVAVYGYFSVEKRNDALLVSVTSAARSAEGSKVSEYFGIARALTREWMDAEKLYHIFLDHSLCEDIELNIKQIELYADFGYTSEMLNACYKCIAALEHVKDSQQLSIENIL